MIDGWIPPSSQDSRNQKPAALLALRTAPSPTEDTSQMHAGGCGLNGQEVRKATVSIRTTEAITIETVRKYSYYR